MILKMCKLLNDLFTFFASRFFRFYFDFAVVVFLYKKRSNRIGSIELHLFLILALVLFCKRASVKGKYIQRCQAYNVTDICTSMHRDGRIMKTNESTIKSQMGEG